MQLLSYMVWMRLKHVFGVDNILGVNFDNNALENTEKQAGWRHTQCSNVIVYTEWLHKSTNILGQCVDFIPCCGSIEGTHPDKITIRLAHAPIRAMFGTR